MERKTTTRKPDSDKKFALLSKATIKLFAESVGHSLTDDVAKIFGEDVNYRLREIVSDASQYMRHAKRSQLTVNDVTRALKDASAPMVVNLMLKTHQWLPEVRLHVLNEEPICLDKVIEKTGSRNEPQPSDITITESWLSASSKGESLLNNRVSMQSLSQYFTQITEALSSDDQSMRQEALADLVTNHSLPHVQTQLLLFIKKWLDRAIEYKDDTRKALEVLDALTNNSYIFIFKDKQWDIVSNILVDGTCLSCEECQKDQQEYGAKILAKLSRSPYFPVRTVTDILDRCLMTLRSDNFGDSLSSTGAMYVIYTLQPLVILREDLIDGWLDVLSTQSNNVSRITVLSIILDCISYIIQSSRKTSLAPDQMTRLHRLVSASQSHCGYLLPCRFLTTLPLTPHAPALVQPLAQRRRRIYPRQYPRPRPSLNDQRRAGPAWDGCVPPVHKHQTISVSCGEILLT